MAETKTKPTTNSVTKFIAAVENDFRREDAKTLLKLGKHKGGLRQCLYINKLADVDLAVLKKILRAGVVEAKNTWPVTAS